MTAAWPGTLPQFVEEGAEETLPDDAIESQIDNGLPQTRRRRIMNIRDHKVAILCDATQLAAFEDFYRDTLKDGVLPFTWVSPRTQAAATFRFRQPPPQVTARISGVLSAVQFTLVQIA